MKSFQSEEAKQTKTLISCPGDLRNTQCKLKSFGTRNAFHPIKETKVFSHSTIVIPYLLYARPRARCWQAIRWGLGGVLWLTVSVEWTRKASRWRWLDERRKAIGLLWEFTGSYALINWYREWLKQYAIECYLNLNNIIIVYILCTITVKTNVLLRHSTLNSLKKRYCRRHKM